MGMEIDIVESGKQPVKNEVTSLPQNLPNITSLNENIQSSETQHIQNTNLNLYPQNLIDLPVTNPTAIDLNNVEINRNIFPEENVMDEQAYPVSNIQPEIDIGENYPVDTIETNQGTYIENNDINQYIQEPAPILTPQDELNQIFSETKNKIENIKDTAETLINNPITYHIAKSQAQNLYQNATNQITDKITNQITNKMGEYGITNPVTNAILSHQIKSYAGQINDNIINNAQDEYNNLELTATKYLSADEVSKALNTNIQNTVDNKINDVKEDIKQKVSSYFPTPLEQIENIVQTKYLNKYNVLGNLLGTNNIKTEENKILNTPNYDTPFGNETILNGRPVKIINIEGEENIHICPSSISDFCKILFA